MPRDSNSHPKNPATKRVTMRDIAKVAGVHVMTVSDALNNTRSVAPATREKVKRIAEEMNYIPHFAARALATGRTGIVAVLSGAMNEPYFANMVHFLEKPMMTSGYQMLLLRNQDEVQNMLEAKGNTTVDGAIAIGRYHLIDQFWKQAKVPLVSIGSWPYDYVDNVIVDMTSPVREALQLMVDGGCQRIAYVATSQPQGKSFEARAKPYVEFMQSVGRSPEIINLGVSPLTQTSALFRNHIRENGAPDGLFCHTDHIAMSAYRALRDEDYRVPEDVLIVGCDGELSMEYFDPPLSTIIQPMEEMCAVAWQFFLGRIKTRDLPLQRQSLNGQLVVRQSLLRNS